MRHVSLHDANQYLSRYIHAVEQGEEIIITRHGQPVAKLSAVDHPRPLTAEQQAALDRLVQSKLSAVDRPRPLTAEQQAALDRLGQRMQTGHSLGGERFDRDAAHER